jgi:NADH dehydrogenase
MAKGAADATGLADAGADLYPGDIRSPETVRLAMRGVSVAVSAVQGLEGTGGVTPQSVDRDGNCNLVDAALEAGASVVLMSAVGAAPDSPMEMFRMKWAAEEHLRASSVPWTILRATVFAETWADILRQAGGGSGRLQVFGRGDNPINFVAISDVVPAVVRAVLDPSLRGQIIELGGPDHLTFNEFATQIDVDGRAPKHLPRILLRIMGSAARPFNPQLARQARAAVYMDTADMTFDIRPSHAAYPWLTATPVGSEAAPAAKVQLRHQRVDSQLSHM